MGSKCTRSCRNRSSSKRQASSFSRTSRMHGAFGIQADGIIEKPINFFRLYETVTREDEAIELTDLMEDKRPRPWCLRPWCRGRGAGGKQCGPGYRGAGRWGCPGTGAEPLLTKEPEAPPPEEAEAPAPEEMGDPWWRRISRGAAGGAEPPQPPSPRGSRTRGAGAGSRRAEGGQAEAGEARGRKLLQAFGARLKDAMENWEEALCLTQRRESRARPGRS